MKLFGEAEKRILSYFQKGSKIIFKGQEFSIIEADKPTCLHGEPKTDIYVLQNNKYMMFMQGQIYQKKREMLL